MTVFHRARWTLAAWYLIIIASISLIFSVVIYRVQAFELDRFAEHEKARIEARFGVPSNFIVFENDFVNAAKRRIIERLTAFNLLVILASTGLGYFLAGRTLEPIEQMVQEQRRFISDAAHELRTPLTAMKTSLEVYLRDPSSKIGDARELAKDNIKDVDRLQKLTDSLLTLSQVQEGNGQIPHVKVELDGVVDEVIKNVAPLAKKKKMTLEQAVTPLVIRGYRPHIVELLTILTDNAVKYSEAKGVVKIKVTRSGSRAKLSVKDTGMGIHPHDIPHIFDRFYRSDSARSHNGGGGYGLGLAIAKKIVDAHKGSIDVASTVGKGSEFVVSLPLFSSSSAT